MNLSYSENGKIKMLRYPNFDSGFWREIPWAPEYYVHPDGFIKSVKITTRKRERTKITKEKILSMFTICGYLSVNLVEAKSGLRKSARVHCLVAEMFLGPRPEGYHAMHLNGEKIDARLVNIKYGTPSENEKMKVLHGKSLQGERHHQSKLKNGDIPEIRNRLGLGESGTSIAKSYGVDPSTICAINRGRTWLSV